MRYRAKYANFVLYKKNGQPKYVFKQGVLDLGDGNTINTDDLQVLFPNLQNNARFGLGVLFVEAPILATNSQNITRNRWYEVITPTVTINGMLAEPGQVFYLAENDTISGTGTIARAFRENDENEFILRAAAFKLRHLLTTDEVTGYHRWDESGYIPRNTLDSDGVGYISNMPR